MRYRGYPIEQLAENSSFLEVAYLLLSGELPTETEFEEFENDITYHTMIHEKLRRKALKMWGADAATFGTKSLRRRQDLHDWEGFYTPLIAMALS